MKTKKALQKRVKFTGTGKILRRFTRQNHFNARDTGDVTRRKRGQKLLKKENSRVVKVWLPNS